MENIQETKINLRSESVQEILGRVPNAFILWGNTIILFLILGMLIISSIIHYPVLLDGNVEMVPNIQAKEVHAPISGSFIGWNGKNGIWTKTGEQLGFIKDFNNQILELNSPQSGSLLVDPYLKEGNYVNKGDLLFKVLQSKPTAISVHFTFSVESFDKSNKGKQVKLKIYTPNSGHKRLLGTIGNISKSKEGLYELQIVPKNFNSGNISEFLGKVYRAEVELDNPKLIKYFFSSTLGKLGNAGLSIPPSPDRIEPSQD